MSNKLSYKEAAAMVFQRTARFCDGYDVNNELKQLLTKFFGDKTLLEKHGLTHFYNHLKSYVVHNKCIGLIIYGDIHNNNKFRGDIIGKYTDPDNNVLDLYGYDLCKTLLEQYFTEDEIKDACFKTPNFNIYYKP